MSKLRLSVAVGDYDRNRPLLDGRVRIDGVAGNRHVFENFLQHHHRQGLSKRRLAVDELFHPAATEAHAV